MRLLKIGCFLSVCGFVSFAFADSLYFCAQNSQYIKVGMTTAQVKQSCGDPKSIQKGNKPVYTRVPVVQWVYHLGSMTTRDQGGYSFQRGTSTPLIVSIKEGKISAINFSGQSTESATLCKNKNFVVGDLASSIRSYCGKPDLINKTFEKVPTGATSEVEFWVYQPAYQKPIRLVFADGLLQAIETGATSQSY